MQRKNLFPINKIPYIKNHDYRKHNCILCKVLEGSDEVDNLMLHNGDLAAITLNLYPYNPGHLMVFPKRHIVDIRELEKAEEEEVNFLIKSSMNLLEALYSNKGFNIGYNMGENSGASIEHLHCHIVPRYPNELGFVDVISGSKLIIEDPSITAERLKKEIKKHL